MGLADAGLTVCGIDNSARMLAVAREKLTIRPEVRLIEADIRDFDLDRAFDLVVLPFDTFSLLDDANAQIKTLQGCRRHLAGGGRVVIDVVNPLTLPEVEQNGLMHPRFEAAVGERRISARQRAEVDPATQTMRLTIEYRESDSGGDRSTEVQIDIRWAYRYELEALMRLAGLAVDDVWGDYDFGDYDVDSPRLIIAGRRGDPKSLL
jgi:SAM-dependent methyltransferase